MISKFSVKKPYTVIVGVVLVIILGIVSFTKMTTDLLPSMELPYAIVMTTYQGASPETVETTVTRPVEQSMATISNIKEVNSISSENMSMVVLEFEGDTDMNAVSLDMREKLDMIKGYWPDEVGNPTIMKLNPDMMPVMVTAMDSDELSTSELSELINDKIAPSIEAVDGVASVSTTGLVEEQINAIISEKKIDKLNKKIQKALNGQFEEAQNKIDQAKAQMESGKNTLDAQRSKVNTQLAKAQTALTDGQLTLAQKEVEVTSAITNLKTQKTTLQATQKLLSQQISKMEEQIKGLSGTAKLQMAAQINELKEQKKTADQSVKTIDKNLKALQKALKQVQQGKKEINAKLTEFSIQSASANQKMTTGEIQLAQGESQLQSSQQKLDESKKQAEAAADIKDKLTVENVKALLTAQNFEMPAGYITENNVQYLVRVGDKAENLKELQNMELMDLGIDGIPPIKLSDVADVAVVDNSDDIYCRVNGNNGVILSVQKQNNYSTADVAHRIEDKMAELTKENKGFHYVNIMDQGIYIDMVTGSVIDNLLMGAGLAIIILLLFLKDIKPTFVIACSIPLSVVFAVVLMYFSGITLNVISLSGLALGVGMLVDNSIVVIENIYRLRKEGVPVKEAAIVGAKGVAGAITSSTLTTISVFLPIVFTTGITKQLFVDMGLTIGYSLVASLIVAVTFVPMMSAGVLHKVTAKDNRVIDKLQNFYQKLMGPIFGHKILAVVITMALFVGSIAGVSKIGTSLIPSMDSTQMTLSLKMPVGSSMEETASMTDTVLEKVKGISDVKSVAAMIVSDSSSGMGTSTGSSAKDESSMYILLKEKKKKTNKEIKNEILKRTKKFDCEILVQESSMDMSALGGSGISIEVKGNDLEKLREIGQDIAAIVEKTKGTKNVTDGSEETTPDIHITVNKKKASEYGLTVASVYQQLSAKLKDATQATTVSLNEKEFSVNVGNSAKNTMTRNGLKNFKLTGTVGGQSKEVELDDIASLRTTDSLSAISRNQQERTLNVTAELKDGYNIGKVSQNVQKNLKKYKMPKGYSYSMGGELESIQDTTQQIGLMLVLAVAFMYLIMVAQFQSLKSPFIILFTIPMAFTGGFLGLLIAGKDLSAIAMIGFVMLSGIIVNNGIVLVDTINQLRDEGYAFEDAILTAGTMRIRPILMTALTTILGLSTMAMGLGQGAEMMQPMAIVTIGGLIYGTLLTLLVVPCIYGLFHRRDQDGKRKGLIGRIKGIFRKRTEKQM